MAKRKNNTEAPETSAATVGYEAQLWQMADALRGSMDAAEYKHVVLGLIFLKYISDAFEEQHAKLEAERVAGRRSRGPGRVPGRQHLLGAATKPAGRTSRPRPSSPPSASSWTTPWQAIERDNPSLKGVLPKDYARPALDKQRLGQLIDLDQQHQRRRRGEPLQGRPRPGLRVLPLAVRQRRGQEGRRVLHAALRGQAAGRDARALQGPGLRPLLRLLGHVRPVGRVHPGARQRKRQRRQGQGRHQHLRPGVELHHLAAGQDEPRHPRHRRPDRPRRHLPQRPPPRPQGRLHPRQSALQRQRLARRASARRQALEVRRAARGQRQLRLGAAHDPPPRAHRHGRLRAGQRLHVLQPVRRGRDPQEHHRGRPGGLHDRPAGPALLLDADSGLPLVPGAGQEERHASATAAGRCSSSTPARWAAWWTAPTAS